MTLLSIQHLTGGYTRNPVLKDVSFEVKSGELVGLIGLNGAGKSTTMKIVAGLLSADSGEVYLDNIDALKNNRKLKEKIGYMPDFFGVYDQLKAVEYLDFYGSSYGIPAVERKKINSPAA